MADFCGVFCWNLKANRFGLIFLLLFFVWVVSHSACCCTSSPKALFLGPPGALSIGFKKSDAATWKASGASILRQLPSAFAALSSSEPKEIDAASSTPECSLLAATNSEVRGNRSQSIDPYCFQVPLNAATVEEALGYLRPVLESHGGAVRLVEVDSSFKRVFLQLEGSCSECPSASSTLKDGIEKSLRDTWPDVEVVEVQNDSSKDSLSDDGVDARRVEKALAGIRPAIEAMGGQIAVVNADGTKGVLISYKGPNSTTVQYGLEMELRDKLPQALSSVTIEVEDFDLKNLADQE